MARVNPQTPASEPSLPSLDVVIVGAGPAGLAAAIAASQRHLSYVVIEKGVLVNSIFHFPRNMVFFTTPELLEIGGIPFTTPFEKPTRQEALRYYRRVVDRFDLNVRMEERVEAINPPEQPGGAFAVHSRRRNGKGFEFRSRAVVVATGYYDNPNLLEIPGEDLPHVSHYYTEAHGYYRKSVVVVGGNNSAAEAALDLFRSGATVTLVHRGASLGGSIKYWVRPDIVNRIREGSITALFSRRLAEIRPASVVLEAKGQKDECPAEAVFLLTGYHPDIDLLERAGVRIDRETLTPQHNPETLETNVPGLYLAGAVAAGREGNRIFIENGRLHGEFVVARIGSQG
jgi:thioredoxin reductase (NADPH)